MGSAPVHTIEDLFGRSVLNDFAELSADLSNTRINHTLGCLCGNEFNTTMSPAASSRRSWIVR